MTDPTHGTTGERTSGYSCSFCGKGHDAGRKLIAGPRVLICDDCVALCSAILIEMRLADQRCSFCGKARTEALRLFAGPNVFVCELCVERCHEALHRQPSDGEDGAVDPWLLQAGAKQSGRS